MAHLRQLAPFAERPDDPAPVLALDQDVLRRVATASVKAG
jgi:hypothetical protein